MTEQKKVRITFTLPKKLVKKFKDDCERFEMDVDGIVENAIASIVDNQTMAYWRKREKLIKSRGARFK